MSRYYSPSHISEAGLKSVAREIARDIDTTIISPGPGGFLWVGRDQRSGRPAIAPPVCAPSTLAIWPGRRTTGRAASACPTRAVSGRGCCSKRYLKGA